MGSWVQTVLDGRVLDSSKVGGTRSGLKPCVLAEKGPPTPAFWHGLVRMVKRLEKPMNSMVFSLAIPM